MYYCVYFCLLCKRDGWTKGDAFCNCSCRMELLAKTEVSKVGWRCDVVVQTPTFNI